MCGWKILFILPKLFLVPWVRKDCAPESPGYWDSWKEETLEADCWPQPWILTWSQTRQGFLQPLLFLYFLPFQAKLCHCHVVFPGLKSKILKLRTIFLSHSTHYKLSFNSEFSPLSLAWAFSKTTLLLTRSHLPSFDLHDDHAASCFHPGPSWIFDLTMKQVMNTKQFFF